MLVWGFLALIALADAVFLNQAGMSLAPGTLVPTILSIAGLLGLSLLYTKLRPDPRIASLAHNGAVALAFAASTALLSYVAVTWQKPLIDAALVKADLALGLDWAAYYHWLLPHKLLYFTLRFAYWTLTMQMILLLVVLNFLGRIGRCWEMQWLFMIACFGCAVFSGLFPAIGAFGYFHIQENEPYVQVFKSLRDGTLKVITRHNVQGIIQFPSLHMAWAIIYVYAARGVRFLFPALLGINMLVFLATPPVGGHHFADLWGGIAVMLMALVIVRGMGKVGILPDDLAKNESVA